MFTSSKNIRIVRYSSLSAIGRRFDRDLSHPLAPHVQSSKSILPLARTASLTKLTPPKADPHSKSAEKNANPMKKKDGEMKLKIKKEIEMLRTASTKAKKLTLGEKKIETKPTSAEIQSKRPSSSIPINNWKQLKQAVPSAGYLYIDCRHESKPTPPSRQITLSRDWVLITEPQQQTLIRVDEYAEALRKFQSLEKIQLFRRFLLIKTFRKWRMVTEYSQLNMKRSRMEQQLQGVYREVYLQLAVLLDHVRLYKFVSSNALSVPLEDYHEYLFNCSAKLMEEIHDYIFVACLEAIFKPIRELAIILRNKTENKAKEVMLRPSEGFLRAGFMQQIDRKYQKRVQRVVVGRMTGEFQLLRSIQFRESFLQFFPVMKKCLYLFNESYVEWVKGVLLDLMGKVEGSLMAWQQEKLRFGEILSDITSPHCDKYTFYSPDISERGIGLIAYPCEITQQNIINFTPTEDYLISLFTQYGEFVTKNLSLRRAVECYSRSRHEGAGAELQLLQQVIHTNDAYTAEQILRNFPLQEQFRIRLKSAVAVNFAEVFQVIDFYNLLVGGFFNCRHEYKTPSEIYEYLESMKIKLLYLPRKVDVGLFALDFTAVHEYLSLQVAALQAELYINVPADFRSLFGTVHETMDLAYRGIRNSMWSVEELLASYACFEAYEQYRVNQLHQDLERFKNYLEVISAKCPQHYHECFMMLVHVKEMRDKLDIKTQIFTQRLPGRLKAFRGDIDRLKQDIWRSLYTEQTTLIAICKEPSGVLPMLLQLKDSDERLKIIKEKMDKLEVIGRLQLEYFIEQELTVNTHSYLKMNNDVRLLISFAQKFVDFEASVRKLFPKRITELQPEELLNILRANVREIKEIYLLLITYETALRELLEKYEGWRQYLETVEEIAFLSVEELAGVRRLKELGLHAKAGLTFEECFNINIHSVYEEIHQIKERKIKVSELQHLFSDLDALEAQPPFQVRRTRRRDSRGKTVRSGRALDQGRNDIVKYEFDNFGNIFRSLQQFQNQLKGLLSSPFLCDYRVEISLRVERLERAVRLLQEISDARGEYNSIMEVELFEEEGHGEERRWLLSQEIQAFFLNYRYQRQEVREFWIKFVNGLSRRSLNDMLAGSEDVEGLMRALGSKMRGLRECVEALVRRKRQEIHMLNLVDSSTVLAVVQFPSYYFELFYSVRQVRKPGAQMQLVTLYDEILTLHKVENEKQAPIEITSFEMKISNELRKLLAAHQSQHPIDHLLNYMTLQLPLQIVYVLDQLYFAEKYLTNERSAAQVLRSLEGEIRLICRNGLRQELDCAHVNYSLALFDQLLASRIELRTRVDNNPNCEIWYRNVLIFQLYQNMLTLRNFNTQILSSFRLVDPAALALAFPFCQKALVKICNAMKFQESIVVEQTEIVASIAARTMSLYFKVHLSPANIENVLFACQQLYPLFVVGFLGDLEKDLVFVFEELNKIERVNSLRTNLSKDRRLLPSIFIHCEKSSAVELSETLKLRFRTVNAVSPCPQVVLCTKMLNHDFIIERGLFLNIVFLLRAYIILLREQKQYYISFQDLGMICDRIMRKVSLEPEGNTEGMLHGLLRDYFQAIDYPLEKLLNNFVQGKNRAQFERSPVYELAQNIIQNTIKELPIAQDTALMLRLKEYQSMKKAFQKYAEQLILQKFDVAFVDKLGTLFQLSFNLENRPIAVIGPYQSGKSLLLRLFRDYLRETVGKGQLSWRNVNLEIFNAVLGTTITENEPIIESFVNDGEEKELSWIVFQGFAAEQNFSLFEHIFNRLGQDVRLKGLPLGDSALSFCELYHCRERYLQNMHSLHNKYVGFRLQSLHGVAPSYICSLSKVYLASSTLSLGGLFQLKINQFLRELVEKNQELFGRVMEDMNEIGRFVINLLEELLIRKIKNFEWVMLMSQKSALERTLQFFFSFFFKQGRQKLDFLYMNEDHLLQLYKLMTYSLHATFENFVDRNSGTLLLKVIKSAYYLVSQDQTRDKFLGKFCLFSPKELIYATYDQLSPLDEPIRELPPSNIIETQEMRLLYRKYLRQLVEMQTALLITGGKESGKSAMIRHFMDKYFNGQMILRGSSEDATLRELSKKLVGMGQAPQQTMLNRKLDYCIYVEEVSCLPRLTKIEKYLHYIVQNGACIEGLHLRAAPTITTILERRILSEELQGTLWNRFIVAFQTAKEYFDGVFSAFVVGKLEASFKNKGKRSLSSSAFEKLTQKYLKLVRYCSENFKRGHKSWTYEFGIVTLKSILLNFMDKYNYDDLLSEEELSSRMNMQILGRLLGRLQEQREVEKIEDRLSGLFDSGELRAMHERSLRENVLLNCNLDQENLTNARIKNVVLTDSLRKFVPKLMIAMRSSNCILINKANIPFNRSVASVGIELLKLPARELLFCENETKFLSQIERASEITLKKTTIAYYYLSLEEIIANPQVVSFISEYLAKQAQMEGKDHTHQCKFILEYSTHNHALIANFLRSGILPHSYIMHFHARSEDVIEIAGRIMEEKIPAGNSGSRQMEAAVKIALRILDELHTFEPPKHMHTFMFSTINTSHLILALVNNYGLLLKRTETKRNALELSLSQLNYMFKEYKERKAVFKQLQAEESSLLAVIGLAKDDHRRRSLEYNSIKNENLKEAIQRNELQISKLQRERDQLISSEKIWSSIYRNAHAAISRTEFAEIKYMFLTNYSIERELFEAIAFVLGDETDLHSLKKCFSDINIMARIKELKVPELPEGRLRQLEGRIEAISKRDKLSCGRNIVEWMKVGCRLGLYRLQREGTMRSLQGRIRRLQQENRQIRQKNRMDEMQKQLIQLQKRIAQKSADLNIVHLKITSIGTELEEVKKQFEELIEFEAFCLQQLETLQEHSKKLLNFCIAEALHFTFVEMLSGDHRRKFRELMTAKMRKSFGGVVTREQSDYFNLLREIGEQRQIQGWLFRPKEYLSSGKKRLIGQLNDFLMHHNLPLVVIDRRSVLLQDTHKHNALYLRMHAVRQGTNRQREYERYSLIIIQMDSWAFSLRLSESEYEGHGKYRILKQGATRVSLPGAIPLVLIVSEAAEDELMGGYKVVDLEYSAEDYYEIVWNTVVKKRAERREEGFLKLVQVERKFMEIVYFLCKKTQNITLKSKELIRTLTNMIQTFNRLKSEARRPGMYYLPVDPQDSDVRLCRVLSKIIELMVTFFPSEEHTSFFFRDLLNTSFDYIEMEGVRDTQSIVNLIMELLTEGFKDKFPFLYLYYIRIYAVEQGIATPIESLNLTALPDPRQQVVDALKDADRDPSNFFKYLPFKNIELQKIYIKLSRTRVRNQAEVARLIDAEKPLSLFNRLILKRALAPKAFQIEIGRMIRDFEDKITLKNKMFLRRYVVKQRLFCVCDAGFWVSKLKFTDEFRLVQLSELPRAEGGPRAETWAVFDDMEQGQQKAAMLGALVRASGERVSVVLFSKQFLREQFREQFKFLPFQHLLNIFEIKELTKVSRSKYSHIFNKVIYFKTELLRRKPFNQRISFSFLFEKIRQQIMNKEDYSIDEIILHFEWDFFLWDSSFETNHLTLHFILSALDANPELINQFVADDKLQDRINAVIAKSRFLRFDESDICRLANQLRDSSARLDVRGGTDKKETDIFYLEFEYKKLRLMKEMETIRRIAEIHLGRVEITAQLVVELQGLLRGFDYDAFSEVLVRLIGWRRLEQTRSVLNIGLIRSEFNFYLLFENSVYVYYEMPSLELEGLSEEPPPHSNDDLVSLTDSKSNIEKEPIKQESGTYKRMTKLQTEADHLKQSKRTTKSLSMMKRLMGRSQRLSIVDPSQVNEANQKSDDEVKQEYFKNNFYIIENRVVGLKKISIKDQKNLIGTNPRTLDLPNNFSIRIIELINLLGSSKSESSRFKMIPKP